MRHLTKWNPSKPNYSADEILRLCKQTRLTYLEIAVFEGVPASAVLRICAHKSPTRVSGRPKALTEQNVAEKIQQVIDFYKKRKKTLDPVKLSRLVTHLHSKLKRNHIPEQLKTTPKQKAAKVAPKQKAAKVAPKVPPKQKTEKKVPVKKVKEPIKKVPTRKTKLSRPQLLMPPPAIPPKKPKRDTVGLVVEYLVNKHRDALAGKDLKMLEFARQKGIEYTHFTRVVKRFIKEAAYLANQQIKQIDLDKQESDYRSHVIEYLARSTSIARQGGNFAKHEYVREAKIDPSTFNKALQKYSKLVKDDVVTRFREIEDERLAQLRQSATPPADPSIKASVELLEAFARKKLPVRHGRIVFDTKKKQNARLESMWRAVLEDVKTFGLVDAVAEKWAQEAPFNLPPLPVTERNRLILIRMEAILEQIANLDERVIQIPVAPITPPTPEPEALIAPSQEIPLISEVRDSITHMETPSQPSAEDEAWLERELAKEALEARRYVDTSEERAQRHNAGFIITADDAQELSRSQLEELRNLGAIYENGNWLLLTLEDMKKFTPEAAETTTLRGWHLSRKPKLLIGIGTMDYTKEWMYKAFDVRLTDNPTLLATLIANFKPDALMIYKSSSGQKLYEAFVQASRDLPLIVFDRGFSDALLSADKQGLLWFSDAHQKRRSFRRNPYLNYRYDANLDSIVSW